mmetsp:Transcript_13273/g.20016  ORF Transcript_13273/g.20016 Transcript_13273/m.20016 type:complete len:133 (+) Transcript_13273:177-575(+)
MTFKSLFNLILKILPVHFVHTYLLSFLPTVKTFFLHILCERTSRYSIDALKAHPWLAKVNWDGLSRASTRSPFVPDMNQVNFKLVGAQKYQSKKLISKKKDKKLVRSINYTQLQHDHFIQWDSNVEFLEDRC